MRKRTINRRQFLRQSATLGSVVAFPTILPAAAWGADRAVAPSNRITLGCIGVGGQGGRDVQGFLGLNDARVLAVCDPYETRRKRAKATVDASYGDQGCVMHRDWREVIARKDIDAVVIATQDHWHALMAVAAAQAGKHLYCEKPFGLSVGQCQAIRDTVRKQGVIFQTGTQQRSERNFRFACELARNGYVGKVHTVEVAAPGPRYKPTYKSSTGPQPVPAGFDWDLWLGPAPAQPYNEGRVSKPDWYLIWDYCAGFIVNWGVHHLDIGLWGCPELATQPFEVECAATYRKEGFTDNVDGWNSTFTYASGLKMKYTDGGQQNGEAAGNRWAS